MGRARARGSRLATSSLDPQKPNLHWTTVEHLARRFGLIVPVIMVVIIQVMSIVGLIRETQTMRSMFTHGILATRSKLDEISGARAIPAPFIAYLLNR